MTVGELKRLLPTAEELERAHNEIDADGPMAPLTTECAVLAVKDPTLKAIVDRLLKGKFAGLSIEDLLSRGAITGALIAGLNLGLRIGEARRKRDRDEPR